jgi:hypothetical protein
VTSKKSNGTLSYSCEYPQSAIALRGFSQPSCSGCEHLMFDILA